MALELQLEERPLAKRQTELLQASEEPASADSNSQQAETGQMDTNAPNSLEEPQRHEEQKHERKALLKNDDHELERVSRVRNPPIIICLLPDALRKLLDEVHKRFFAAHDTRQRRKKAIHDVTVSGRMSQDICWLDVSILEYYSTNTGRSTCRHSHSLFQRYSSGHKTGNH